MGRKVQKGGGGAAWAILGLYWDYSGVILGLYWGYIGIILGLYWGYIFLGHSFPGLLLRARCIENFCAKCNVLISSNPAWLTVGCCFHLMLCIYVLLS